ncbi:hypothetical protein QU487_14970 [Crenobacter sp. SG2305]|uniref:hypothetical protein n=1 Tax=Crenobacter oryzisoli TaxID=3056844 RepID=UPI0025AB4792|nr:hypothetical protein [Crenobacter sp. SG2305]MDN0084039.1 hypothetical protein [Crenobacter sp. SG2305]
MKPYHLAATSVVGLIGLAGQAQAAGYIALPPQTASVVIEQAQTGAKPLTAEEKSARLHAILRQYGLGCGNPNCPLCRGLPPAGNG